MLSESIFPLDIRVKQESDLLSSNGHSVIFIAIKDTNQRFHEIVEGTEIYRLPKIQLFKTGKQSQKNDTSRFFKLFVSLKAVIGYGFEYIYFTLACFLLSLYILIFKKFDVIHTHNPPDTLFLIALFHKLLFRKYFIYDHHDLSPDLYLEKYNNGANLVYKILLYLEYFSCKFADIVIATNESYKNIEIERCRVNPTDIFIVRNGPDLTKMKIVRPHAQIRLKSNNILCYLGAINNQDGVQYLLDIVSKLVSVYKCKDILLLIIGDGDYLFKIKELAKDLAIEDYIFFTGIVKDRNKINMYLSTADIFVDAAPNSFLNNNSTFIKHMEYMVFQKPVVSFALKESMFSLKDAGIFVTPNDADEFAKVIISLISDDEKCAKLGENASQRVKELSWENVSKPLLEAYNKLDMQ